jgi:DNA-binding MarR family transcriptional regulator
MPATAPVFSAQLLGRTEKTLNAILGQLLAGSGVSEPQWVALTLAITRGKGINRAAYTDEVAGALRVSKPDASAQIAELAAAHLLDLPASDTGPIAVTESGQRLYHQVRAATGRIPQRMWGDLPATDLEAAGRVLSTVLGRADAYLSRAPRGSATRREDAS